MNKKRLLIGLSCLLLGVGLIALFATKLVKADYNPNNIIDDYVFSNTGTMNVDQINNFLNSFPSSCISQRNGFSAPVPNGYSPSAGFSYGGYVSAGQIIYEAAQVYKINPQVLLTTLQKEQSLVTGTSGCGVLRYVGAMGYGCPDGGTTYSYSGRNFYAINGQVVGSVSGTCVNSAAKAGFSQQVIHGAWLLKFGQQRSQGNVSWAEIQGNWDNSDDPLSCYGGPMTQGSRKRCSTDNTAVYYDGYVSIDGTSVHMDTGATASLYWYTPHLSGNRNFSTIFQSWFGPTTGEGFQLVVPASCLSACPQYVVYGSIKQHIPDSQTVYAWGLENVTLTTMPDAQLDAISTGPDLGRLMVLRGTPTIYFVDGGKRYRIPWASMLYTWNLAGRTISSVSSGLFTLPGDNGDLANALKSENGSTIYMPDGINGSGVTVIRPYQSESIFKAWEGDNASYTVLDDSSGFFDQMDDAIGSALATTKASYAGEEFQVMGGQRFTTPTAMSSLYPGSPQSVSSATYNRLVYRGSAGVLIQAVGDPTVYLIDGGAKHQILWPNALLSWQPAGQPITQVTAAYLGIFSTGTSIGGYLANVDGQLYVLDSGTKTSVPSELQTAYSGISGTYTASSALLSYYPAQPEQATGFIQGLNSPSVYLLDNSSQLRHIEWPDKLALFQGTQGRVTRFSPYLINSLQTASSPTLFVSDGSANYVIENGKKWTVSPSVKSDWGLGTSQSYDDGTLDRFATGGSLTSSMSDGRGAYFTIKGGAAYGTADSNIAGVWNLLSAPSHSSRLISSLMPAYMLTRYVRSSVPGDNRTFAVDQGVWYEVSAAQANNMTWGNEAMMQLNPSYAPNTITSWPGVLMRGPDGSYYVIDGGGKRSFSHQMIQDQWTGFGTAGTQTVSQYFLNLMPTRGTIERAIKGSGPAVYSADSGAKRHILYPNTYNLYYAPYMPVTDTLLTAMPTGSDIN